MLEERRQGLKHRRDGTVGRGRTSEEAGQGWLWPRRSLEPTTNSPKIRVLGFFMLS